MITETEKHVRELKRKARRADILATHYLVSGKVGRYLRIVHQIRRVFDEIERLEARAERSKIQ